MLFLAAECLRRRVDVDAGIVSSELLVRVVTHEHLALIEIFELGLVGGLGREAGVVGVGRRVDDETAAGTLHLVVVPPAVAAYVLDH